MKTVHFFLALLYLIPIVSSSQSEQPCVLGHITEQRAIPFGGISSLTQQGGDQSWFCDGPVLNENDFIYIIPTVVHVLHNNGPENISDEQIKEAIQNCNQGFWWSVGEEILNVKLALARKDPNGI